jgi:hypothetical protein
MMKIRRSLVLAAALAAVTGSIAVPAASADPIAGQKCNAGIDHDSADGKLSCSAQAGEWMTNVTSPAVDNAPCTHAGDLTYGTGGRPGEHTVLCTATSSGLRWVRNAG